MQIVWKGSRREGKIDHWTGNQMSGRVFELAWAAKCLEKSFELAHATKCLEESLNRHRAAKCLEELLKSKTCSPTGKRSFTSLMFLCSLVLPLLGINLYRTLLYNLCLEWVWEIITSVCLNSKYSVNVIPCILLCNL